MSPLGLSTGGTRWLPTAGSMLAPKVQGFCGFFFLYFLFLSPSAVGFSAVSFLGETEVEKAGEPWAAMTGRFGRGLWQGAAPRGGTLRSSAAAEPLGLGGSLCTPEFFPLP